MNPIPRPDDVSGDSGRFARLSSVADEFFQHGKREERRYWTARAVEMEKVWMEVNEELLRERAQRERTEEEWRARYGALLFREGSREAKELYRACKLGNVDVVDNAFAQDLRTFESMESAKMSVVLVKNHALRECVVSDRAPVWKIMECCKKLLAAGANPFDGANAVSGKSALHVACMHRFREFDENCALVELFVKDPKCCGLVDVVDDSGQTPLGICAGIPCLKCARLLCSFGANVSLVEVNTWKRFEIWSIKANRVAVAATAAAKAPKMGPPHVVILKKQSYCPPSLVVEDAKTLAPAVSEHSPTEKQQEDLDFADTCFYEGRYEEAYNTFASLAEHLQDWTAEDCAQLYFNAAECASKLKRHAETLSWCNRVLQASPLMKHAMILRAKTRICLFDFAGAENDFKSLACIENSESSHEWIACAQRARGLLVKIQNYYQVLGVAPGGPPTQVEIRKAFLKKSLIWHPDKCTSSADNQIRAGFMFKAINEAHSVLSDSDKRRAYDAKLREVQVGQVQDDLPSFEDIVRDDYDVEEDFGVILLAHEGVVADKREGAGAEEDDDMNESSSGDDLACSQETYVVNENDYDTDEIEDEDENVPVARAVHQNISATGTAKGKDQDMQFESRHVPRPPPKRRAHFGFEM